MPEKLSPIEEPEEIEKESRPPKIEEPELELPWDVEAIRKQTREMLEKQAQEGSKIDLYEITPEELREAERKREEEKAEAKIEQEKHFQEAQEKIKKRGYQEKLF